jgi:hypothetical protein
MAEVEQLGQLLDQLEIAIGQRVARVDAGGQVRGWGYPSTTAWLRHQLGTRHSRAVERVTLARQLPRLGQVAQRLHTGELSHGYAVAIAAGVKYLNDTDTAAAEHILLELIDTGASVADVAKTCARITDIIAERDGRDTPGRGRRRGYRRSWLQVTTDLDGRGVHVTGWLTATHASMLRQACAPLAQPAGPGDDRDSAQRFADALYTRLSRGGRSWNATIVIDANTLTNSPDPARERPPTPTTAPHQQTTPETVGVAVLTRAMLRPARTLDGLVVSAEHARQIALNAGLNTLIIGSGGLPLYLGRKTRLVTPAQHKTLMALYDTCIADGCIIPAYLCQIDHINPWVPDGHTNIDNLAPECAYHNRSKTQHPNRVHLEQQNGRWKYHLHRPTFHHPITHRPPTRQPPTPHPNGQNAPHPP